MLQFETSTCDRLLTQFPPMKSIAALLRICLVAGVAVALVACDSNGSEDTQPPSAPSNLSATSGDGEVTLSWEQVEADDLAGYNIYRGTSSLDTLTSENRVTSVTETQFEDPSVQNQTTYYYQVTAVDQSANESAPSGEQKVTPFAGPPDRP
jgi:fibronectin type 3 domain-containing protein